MTLIARTALAVALVAGGAHAQLTMAPASPPARLSQTVGMVEVTVEYSRPGVKGREIFGAMLPYGQVWRTGANASTKVTFDQDVGFGGQDVPAGTYALYTIPNAKSWTVILSKNTGLWGAGGYTADDDLLRLDAAVHTLEEPVESFTIDFQRFHANGADLVMSWADVAVHVPVEYDGDAFVMRQIQDQIIDAPGPVPARTLFDAAKFYYERDMDLAVAAEWCEKACDQQPGAFWMTFFRAEIAAKQGDRETAIAWARKSHEMAAAAESDYGYLAQTKMFLEGMGVDV